MALLLPADGDDFKKAIALTHLAVDAPKTQVGGFYSYFLFARGLGEYRQGRFDEASVTLTGDASRVLGPAPRLVHSMALHQQGRHQEARFALADAVTAHDWRIEHCRNQDAWIYHILRREAEQMILPNLAAFLAGEHRPSENEERLALVGACQASGQTLAMARLYESVFAEALALKVSTNSYRYAASRAAALVACGQGSDVADLDAEDRARWRRLAIQWLHEELAAIESTLAQSSVQSRSQTMQRLMKWSSERDFAGIRDPAPLENMSQEERQSCLAVWLKLSNVIAKAQPPR